MPFPRRTIRPGRAPKLFAALVLSLGALSALAGPAAPAAGADDGEKIQPKLERRLDAKGSADFWVRFEQRADLTKAAAIEDWTARGAAVVEALRDAATAGQADVRAQLDAGGVDYESFWATNAIYVPDGSAELAEDLAAERSVEGLYPSQTYDVPVLSPEEQGHAAASIEWGIQNIKADRVWQEYGDTGAGIVVANIDTGVQYDHPALVGHYRGNNGDGTFTHDYNWFDSSGTCNGKPCDNNGHGTHTMGTMVGDDGMGNQIGVAPGATWIAANGCATCSDEDLIESGQWILAPTRADGSDADPAMRPNIVNNSWGNQIPSTFPFMEDITDAWAAAGIFGVWSNGNIGPTCDTSSTPGSRISNYSIGAYDVNDTIADFSSRGVGQDGEIKPNVSAPGVNVRSAVPGNQYAYASGTSMAAPHVAGAVALLWSAAPGLVGDVDATRNLLDGSAIDAPDDSCGGTGDDNNVYGEGRLDALSLIDAAPVQDTGTLTLHAVDSRTHEPIGGARITLSGPVSRERVTGANGTFSVAVPAGTYDITASAFGYADLTSTATVVGDQVTTADLSLDATARVKLSGTVTDGGGQGWPLYAEVSLHGVPGATTYTDPETGRYTISVPAGATYTVTATPVPDGYQSVTEDIAVGRKNVTHDLVAPVVFQPCRTPGYGYHYDGVGAELDNGLPSGWTVSDENDSGTTWAVGDNFENFLGEPIANQTGGSGGFALGMSPGLGVYIDTSLVTPTVNLSDVDEPVIGFRQHFTRISENADVELSLDGGASWETVLHQDRSVRGPQETVVPIPQAAGRSDVQVRFHYSNARFSSTMWQLDDIYVGRRTCAPVEGAMVVGQVSDANTGQAVNGALVADSADQRVVTRSIATPQDPAVGDGFYSLFVPERGRHQLSVSAHEYATDTKQVNVRPGDVKSVSYSLKAGELQIRPDQVVGQVRPGRATTERLTLRNTGSAAVTVRLSEQEGLSPQLDTPNLASTGKVMRVEGDFSPLAFDGHRGPEGKTPEAPATPWVQLGDYPTRIMDNAVAEHGGQVYSVGGVDGAIITDAAYRYDPASDIWTSIASLPEERESAAAAFIDGRLYVATGWPDREWASKNMFVYDPATGAWTTGADAPVGVAAAGRAVLDGQLYLVGGCTNACGEDVAQRYDPATDTWERLAPYPEGRGHLACGALEGQIYCTGGIARTSTQVSNSTYAYDPATDTWTQKADLPVRDLWGMAYTASYDRLLVSGGITNGAVTNQSWIYDADQDSWGPLPAAKDVLYRGGSACGLFRIGGSVGGFTPANSTQALPTYGACRPEDVPWLSEDRQTVTIQPGKTVQVSVRMDADDRSAGSYDASLWFKEDTPYLVPAADVTMRISGS